ncbi:MAG: MFS transporter [Candidatus Aenigmarchaeota archaeon]|nr:MFS transporter [Candidatus Aenigmarchaeota archaeon]
MSLERNIRLMYIINFLKNLTFFGAISIPFFLGWGGLNYTQIFLLQAWFMFWMFFFEIPTGLVADKLGRKTSIILSGILTSLGFLIYGSIRDFRFFLLAEFLIAIGFTLISGADSALIYDTLKQKKKSGESKKIFANYQIAGTLGIIIAFPAGSLIAGTVNIPYPDNLAFVMLLTAFPLFTYAIISFLLEEPKRTRPSETYFETAKNGLKYLAKHKHLRPLALNFVLISTTLFFMYWFYQPLLGSAGVDITYYGFVAAAYNILAVLLISKTALWEKIFGTRNVLYITAFVPGILYIILGFTKMFFITILGILLITSLRGLREPLFSHYMNYYIKSNDRATVLSSINMLQRLLTMVLYVPIGMLTDISLNYTLIFLGLLTLVFGFLSRVEEESLKE